MIFCHWLVLTFVAILVNGGLVQLADLQLPSNASSHKQDVVNLFVQSYEAYQKYAWGHDDLLPVTESYSDILNGWGASIADALDTMWIMGFYDWFEQGVNYTANVDFSVSRTNATVSLFEATIRFVGGLLSTYELSGYKYDILVQKAEQVAQQMAYAWIGVAPDTAVTLTPRCPGVRPALTPPPPVVDELNGSFDSPHTVRPSSH